MTDEPDTAKATEQATDQATDQTTELTDPRLLPRSEWTPEYLRSFAKIPKDLPIKLRLEFMNARSHALYGDLAAQKRAAAAAARPPGPPVVFTSAERESYAFDIMSITPERDPTTWHLIWRVPADRVETFAQHHHVQSGRVRRAAK